MVNTLIPEKLSPPISRQRNKITSGCSWGDLEIKVGLLPKVSCPDYVPLCLNEFLLKWKKNEAEEEEE